MEAARDSGDGYRQAWRTASLEDGGDVDMTIVLIAMIYRCCVRRS